MIAIDTNILIYAHRSESTWYRAASSCLKGLAEGRGLWAIPWPCLHEFLAIVTHPRIYSPPTSVAAGFDQVAKWLRSPRLVLIGETEEHFDVLSPLVLAAQIAGPRIHDAKIAAICLQHGVSELWTADRDFSRFPKLKTRNPLVA